MPRVSAGKVKKVKWPLCVTEILSLFKAHHACNTYKIYGASIGQLWLHLDFLKPVCWDGGKKGKIKIFDKILHCNDEEDHLLGVESKNQDGSCDWYMPQSFLCVCNIPKGIRLWSCSCNHYLDFFALPPPCLDTLVGFPKGIKLSSQTWGWSITGGFQESLDNHLSGMV